MTTETLETFAVRNDATLDEAREILDGIRTETDNLPLEAYCEKLLATDPRDRPH